MDGSVPRNHYRRDNSLSFITGFHNRMYYACRYLILQQLLSACCWPTKKFETSLVVSIGQIHLTKFFIPIYFPPPKIGKLIKFINTLHTLSIRRSCSGKAYSKCFIRGGKKEEGREEPKYRLSRTTNSFFITRG